SDLAFMTGVVVWAFVTLVAPQLVVFGAQAGAPVGSRGFVEAERRSTQVARARATSESLGRAYRRFAGEGPLTPSLSEQPFVRAELERLWRNETIETRRILQPFDTLSDQVRSAQSDL